MAAGSATGVRRPAARGKRLPRRLGDGLLLAALVAPLIAFGVHDVTAHGSLARLGTNLVQGLSNGAIWATIALGYTLVYGIVGLINFAHGDVYMVGSFTAVSLFGTLGLAAATGPLGLVAGIALTVVVAGLLCGTLNTMIERVAYRPLRGQSRLAPVLTAVGMSFVLQNVGLLWLGPNPFGVPDLIGAQKHVLDVAGVSIARGDLLAFGLPIPLLLGLSALVLRTDLGRAMRATAQNAEAARLMGIDVDRTIASAFFIGGALAGAGGVIAALYQTTVWYFQGFQAGLIAFTAAVMGGIGDLRGAVVGGLAIGVIQSVSDNRIGPDWTSIIVFSYLIAIITLKPDGLFGRKERRAG